MDHYLFKRYEKNTWKRYFSSLLIIIFFISIGSILYVLSNLVFGNESSYLDEATGEFVGLDPIMDMLFSHIIFIGMLIGIWVSIRFIHKRSLISLVTTAPRINWSQIWWGFSLYFVLFAGFKVLDFTIFPNHYSINMFKVSDFILLFIIVFLFVPIQTTAEELLFRGFLLQWFAKKISNPIILSSIIAIIFSSLHFSNPEMNRSAFWIGLNYVFSGFILTLISVKMGRSELSIGAHAANNMFLSWFISDVNSVNGEIPAIFEVNNINPFFSFIWSVCVFIIFYMMSLRKFREDERKTNTNSFARGSIR